MMKVINNESRHQDIKEHGIRNKFRDYMEQFLKEIYNVCKWAGWEDSE